MVRANKLGICYLRPIAFYGSEKMGISTRGSTVHVADRGSGPGARYPVRTDSRTASRADSLRPTPCLETVTMPRWVATAYTNSILANLEATQDGYDEEEHSPSCPGWCRGAGELRAHRDGGSTRAGCASCAGRRATPSSRVARGFPVSKCRSRRLTRDDIYIADEAFFAGTAEVTPDSRTRQSRHRQRQPRPDHREAADPLLRYRQWSRARVRTRPPSSEQPNTP